MIVDSFRFLPRSFRPLYEGRGAFPGEEHPVWTSVANRLAGMRIALLTSAGMHLKSEPSFDLDTERTRPDWGDPSWRAIPADVAPDGCAVSHLHINDEDVRADPEICLPVHGLKQLAADGVIGGPVDHHVAVMGYQDHALRDWRDHTAPAIVAHLRDQQADGIVLAPA